MLGLRRCLIFGGGTVISGVFLNHQSTAIEQEHLKMQFDEVKDDNLELFGVYFCMRHGDRTPVLMLEPDRVR